MLNTSQAWLKHHVDLLGLVTYLAEQMFNNPTQPHLEGCARDFAHTDRYLAQYCPAASPGEVHTHLEALGVTCDCAFFLALATKGGWV